jgi:hypothetical protein
MKTWESEVKIERENDGKERGVLTSHNREHQKKLLLVKMHAFGSDVLSGHYWWLITGPCD